MEVDANKVVWMKLTHEANLTVVCKRLKLRVALDFIARIGF